MRLQQKMIDFISTFTIADLPKMEIRLFGSRVNNQKKGGDIDLLFLTDKKLTFAQKSRFKNDFFQRFGEQKIDIVNFTFDEQTAFKDIILTNSILLCQKIQNI
jgi:predicted nucleotidyltransferase